MEYLEKLKVFSPELLVKAKNYYNNPEEYFNELYSVFCQVQELTWFIKHQAAAHDYWRSLNKVQKNHICWSTNRYELILSKELLAEQIPHIRQYCLDQGLMVDFYIPSLNIFVEVDGEYHQRDVQTKVRDQRKQQLIEKRGTKLLRFSCAEVWKDPNLVIQKIKKSV